MRRKSGFTLIELLIVLAVISTLLGAFVPVASNAIVRAKGVQVAFNLGSIMRGIDYHMLLQGQLPESLNEIARNLDPENYGVAAFRDSNRLTVVVFTKQLAGTATVKELLPDATASLELPEEVSYVRGGLEQLEEGTFFYMANYSL